jgi:putative ABC transport system ATP-binding protein
MSIVIKARNLTKCYQRGSETIEAVSHVDLDVNKGEIVSVTGPSGSGKTTLVNILGCLDNPSSGTLFLESTPVFTDGSVLSESALTKIRRRFFGYVFQKFFLLPTLTVEENILLPEVFRPDLKIKQSQLADLADLLGIKHRLKHLPRELSGGEMQRVAIARALIANPRILIADEPTGNLDSKRSDEIKELFYRLNRETGLSIVLVTHNPDLARIADRILQLEDGRLKNE